jgi:lipopolysaccharide/colanic/teichoic acid biosynthesis glycosyltransferase
MSGQEQPSNWRRSTTIWLTESRKKSTMASTELDHRLQQGLKRALDVTLSGGGLVLLSPVMAAIALAIRFDSPGPVIFRHQRVGRHGQPFDLFKFRSMIYGGDDTGYMDYLRRLIESEQGGDGRGLPYHKMANDVRVTRIGKALRHYYLDELPQLWNILKGEMSLVGPRPHVQFEVDQYRPEQRRRLLVKPGATGLWQVAGKANCTFTELIELDLEYIDRWSLTLDLQIIMKTLWLMLRGGEGIWMRAVKRIPQAGPLAAGEERKKGEREKC